MVTESRVTHKTSCDNCGSSDANAVYDDGHTFCFSCNHLVRSSQVEVKQTRKQVTKEQANAQQILDRGNVDAIKDRRISRATAAHYGVTIEEGKHHYPYHDAEGKLVAVKTRIVEKKDFVAAGEFKKAGLFGQHLFPAGGKYLTITEGELDAMAAFQMMGSKYPFVSLKDGAAGAERNCKASFDYIDSFDKIVLSFDTDDVGQKAAAKVAEMFGPKVVIVQHRAPYKDACDYLKKEALEAYNRDWWNAKAWQPEGIVGVSDIKERLKEPPKPGIPWCFPTLTKLTYGRRWGEIYGFGAGVGVGKTDVFTQQIAYDLTELKMPVGVIYLEQPVTETVQRVAGKIKAKLFHVPNPDGNWTEEEYFAAIDELVESDDLWLFEHFGAKGWESIKSKIRYLVKAKGCRLIYLDHLTALIANAEDERRELDKVMADMATFGQETGCIIHFVSHLTTPEGKSHEEGGRVLEKHFTGSRAIARWAHYLFGLERNKQAEDPVERQTTTFRVLKDRATGRASGETFKLMYDRDTGRLFEVQPVEETL